MIAWFTRNDVAANLLLITIIAAGLYSLFRVLPVEMLPRIESSVINVTMSLRGSTPEDTEQALATRIEEAIKDLDGIKEYSSRSTENSTTVRIEALPNTNARDLLDDVKTRVDAINTFPSEADKPTISLQVFQQPAITVGVSGNVSEREIRELAESIRSELLEQPEITQVELEGVRDYEITVEIDRNTMREFDLTPNQIANAISQSSLDLSGGNLSSSGGDVLLRSVGQAYSKTEFDNIVLATNPNGSLLRLGDVAHVSDGFEEKAVLTRFNGKPAALISVSATGDQSILNVAERVRDYVKARQQTIGDVIQLDYWGDWSKYVKARISVLTMNALQGGLLVLLLLSIFLRPAVAFWVFLGIPASFCGAWLTLAFLGVSINMVSLFAFIVVLGIVVDDAIVTGESVYTHMQQSKNALDAAIKGTREVSVPVTFGIMTTVAAFMPLAFIDGDRGQIFAQITAVVVPVLLFSLVESKWILPAHLKHVNIHKPSDGNRIQQLQRKFASGFERAILTHYQPVLRFCLNNKRNTILAFFGLIIIIFTSVSVGHMRFTFWPTVPSDIIQMSLVMPNGTPHSVTDSHMERARKVAQDLQTDYQSEDGLSPIKHIMTRSGSNGGRSHIGFARLEIEHLDKQVDSRELAKEWRERLGPVPGAEELTVRAEMGRAGDPIDIQLIGSDFAVLEEVGEELKIFLTRFDGVFDIHDSFSDGKEELRIELTDEAHLLGISRADIIGTVRNTFFGLEAQRIQRGRDDVRVMIRAPIEERRSISDLDDILIQTPQNQQVPLSNLATLSPELSPSVIYRINGFRTLNVIADMDKNTVNMTALMADLRPFIDELQNHFRYLLLARHSA